MKMLKFGSVGQHGLAIGVLQFPNLKEMNPPPVWLGLGLGHFANHKIKIHRTSYHTSMHLSFEPSIVVSMSKSDCKITCVCVSFMQVVV